MEELVHLESGRMLSTQIHQNNERGFRKMPQHHNNSNSKACNKFGLKIFTQPMRIIILIIFNSIPISMITVALIYLDRKCCTAGELSILLLVGGFLLLCKGLVETCFWEIGCNFFIARYSISHCMPGGRSTIIRNGGDRGNSSNSSRIDFSSVGSRQPPPLPPLPPPHHHHNPISNQYSNSNNETENSHLNSSSIPDSHWEWYVQTISQALSFFSFAWFIAISVVMYRLWAHVNFDLIAPPEDYCDRFLYLYVFWLLTSAIVIALTVYITFISVSCITAWKGYKA